MLKRKFDDIFAATKYTKVLVLPCVYLCAYPIQPCPAILTCAPMLVGTGGVAQAAD